MAQAVRTGLGLDAQINLVSRFDRKNYFYADLPQGYQISQLYHPIVGAGHVEVEVDGATRRIGVTRLHLEQDAGKSLHDQDPSRSFIDLNRSGVALMEIVSEPDIRSPEEAGAYLRKLRSILRYLGTCDGNMEEGSMRADVNVSVRKHGEPFRTRCEVKNVSSMRFVMQAVELEARRQIAVWEDGGEVVQETRLYRQRARGDTVDAVQGGCARLPVFPGPRSVAAGAGRGVGGRAARGAAGAAGRQAGAFRGGVWLVRLRRRACWWPSSRWLHTTRRLRRGGTPRRRPTGSWVTCSRR